MIGLTSLLEAGLKIIDKVVPDPAAKAEAQRKLIEMQQHGELEELKISMSAIIAEAQSPDPYTSRARPSFMYVMYILLLASIPFGMLHAFDPGTATNVAAGFNAWLKAIPQELYQLFGVGYLGYVGARSIDKWKGKT